MIVLPAQAPPARRWLAHLVRAAAGVIRAGDRFDDAFAFEAEAVATLARRHGVAPLLHCGLAAGRIGDPLPGSFRRACRDAWTLSRRRSAVIGEVGAAALVELRDAAVDAVPVGAFALVRGKDDLYLEPGLRPVERLDLVLPAADVARATARLRRLGFAPFGAEPQGGALRLARRVSGVAVAVRLHPRVADGRGRRLDGERFVARHVHRAADGDAEPSVEGQLLYVTAGLARGGLDGWLEILDVHRLVEARPDWVGLLREARTTGLRRALYVGLAASRELLRSPVPKEVLAELAPGLLRRRLLHWRLAAGVRDERPAPRIQRLPAPAPAPSGSAPEPRPRPAARPLGGAR